MLKRGTTVTITLPIRQEETHQVQEQSESWFEGLNAPSLLLRARAFGKKIEVLAGEITCHIAL